LADRKAEKDYLLNLTRGQKAEFERLVAQKERDIEQIRNQIFLLEGVGIALPPAQGIRNCPSRLKSDRGPSRVSSCNFEARIKLGGKCRAMLSCRSQYRSREGKKYGKYLFSDHEGVARCPTLFADYPGIGPRPI